MRSHTWNALNSTEHIVNIQCILSITTIMAALQFSSTFLNELVHGPRPMKTEFYATVFTGWAWGRHVQCTRRQAIHGGKGFMEERDGVWLDFIFQVVGAACVKAP